MVDESVGIPHKIACLYFHRPLVSIEPIFKAALECFSQLKLTPNLMATDFDKKVIDFRRSLNKAEKRGISNSKVFAMFAKPDYLEDPSMGFWGMFCLDNKACYPHWPYAVFSFRDHMLPDKLSDDLCMRVAQIVHPEYGYRDTHPTAGFMAMMGTSMSFHCNLYYLAGFIEYGRVDRLNSWYVLNKSHLHRRFPDDTTFADWVAADSDRGRLVPYVNDSWVWHIPRERVTELMAPLADADILFNGEKHVRPWDTALSARVLRGDFSAEEGTSLFLKEVEKTGRVPVAPHWERRGDGAIVVDKAAVTRWLKKWGHPAGNLPDSPSPFANPIA